MDANIANIRNSLLPFFVFPLPAASLFLRLHLVCLRNTLTLKVGAVVCFFPVERSQSRMTLCPTLFGRLCVCVGALERKGCVCFVVMQGLLR